MLRQISLLSGLQLVNLFGINEVRHTKDSGKKKRFLGMAVLWTLLGGMLLSYVCMFSYGMTRIGMTETIPVYLYTVVSLLLLVFNFFKAGSIIFQKSSYEMLVSLPVSGAAVVVSRFLTMYVTDLLLTVLIMLPGLGMYAVFARPGILFYPYGAVGMLLLPLLPITLATAMGAVIMAVSSRMRRKSLAAAVLTIAFAGGVVVISLVFSAKGESMVFEKELLQNLAETVEVMLVRSYPPSGWFAGAVGGNGVDLLLLGGVTVLTFTVLVAVLQRYFYQICAALNATSARHDYKLGSLEESSPLKALWKRELRRYFASSIYVTNTMIGYLLMALLAAGIFFAGLEKTEELLQLPGGLGRTFPLLLGGIAGIMPSTSNALSMEGKQFWLVQTLPVSERQLWDSKILTNLTVMVPFYLLAMLFGLPAAGLSFLESICFAVTPAVFLLFSAVAGMRINLKFPIFNWENDVQVVKQSASTLMTMLTVFLITGPCVAMTLILDEYPAAWIWAGVDVVLLLLTILVYRNLCRQRIYFRSAG